MDDLILLALRLTLGGFFVLARFRFFWEPGKPKALWFNRIRFVSLQTKIMMTSGLKHPAWAWLVAVGEVGGGLLLIVGLFTQFAAAIIGAILLVATVTTFREKVYRQKPVDGCDVICCYLWTVEPLYLLMAVLLTLAGGGFYSLDEFLRHVL